MAGEHEKPLSVPELRFREEVAREARGVEPRVIELRRHLHQHPERSKREETASALAVSFLEGLGIEVSRCRHSYGVVGLLRGGQPGRTVALRADMDAVKVQERTDLLFASQVEGVMHACGHDAHTAMLLGAAQVLVRLRDRVPGTVKFLFQPSEEAFPGGALPMIEEGVLEAPRVDALFAAHVAPWEPPGVIAVCPGPSMGAVASVNVKVRGVGGHAFAPHLSVDAIVVASHVVVALQSLLTRRVNPMEPALLTFGTIQGGTRDNIIADEVVLRGNIGTMRTKLRDKLPGEIEKVVKGVCDAFGASYEVEHQLGYPAVINHRGLSGLVLGVARSLYGEGGAKETVAIMGGDDVSYFLQEVPGVMWWVGCWNKEKHPKPTRLHDGRFELDERCLVTGTEFMASMALAYLYS